MLVFRERLDGGGLEVEASVANHLEGMEGSKDQEATEKRVGEVGGGGKELERGTGERDRRGTGVTGQEDS